MNPELFNLRAECDHLQQRVEALEAEVRRLQSATSSNLPQTTEPGRTKFTLLPRPYAMPADHPLVGRVYL